MSLYLWILVKQTNNVYTSINISKYDGFQVGELRDYRNCIVIAKCDESSDVKKI